MEDLATFVRRHRKAAQLTQKALAEKAGLLQPEISDIERRKTKLPGPEARRGLAEALGVSHLELLVAAGELRESEIPAAGAPQEIFAGDDFRSQIVELLTQVNPIAGRKVLGNVFVILKSEAEDQFSVEESQ